MIEYRLCTSTVIVNEGRILMGRRNRPGGYGHGLMSFPGGKVDPGEEVLAAACREVKEETDLIVKPEDLIPLYFNVNRPSSKSKDFYTNLYFYTMKFEGEPKNLEPHKCDGWDWYNTLDVLSDKDEGWEDMKTVIRVLRSLGGFHAYDYYSKTWEQLSQH